MFSKGNLGFQIKNLLPTESNKQLNNSVTVTPSWQPLLSVCVYLCMCVWLTHPSWSVRFHSTSGVGISGEPSYKTTEAPTARADTSQFHIIQPV